MDSEPESFLPGHPLHVKPAGNAFGAKRNLLAASGLFSRIPEEFLNLTLEQLDAGALLRLGATCKALYAYCRTEELWRNLFIENIPNGPSKWLGTWRATYLNLQPGQTSSISCDGLFSDLIFRPFHCAHIPLQPYAESIPRKNRIPRISNLTPAEFSDWCNKPFILTDPVKSWPIYKTWSIGYLRKRFGETCFRAEAVDWPLRVYLDYLEHNADESPLYLFDRGFVEKMGLNLKDATDYSPPECFKEDMFEVFGSQRPDHRWLIVGPEGSGSTFHKDPNATSAWNAVIRGAKYWIMFPSSDDTPPPPGVFISEDQAEVTSPLSIAEWLLAYHTEARNTKGCLEGVCYEGEVLHVPSGVYEPMPPTHGDAWWWWHLVVNLSPAIAITQNFVPRAHLPAVLRFLRDKPEQVSGFRKEVDDPYQLCLQRMKEWYPETLNEGLAAAKEATKKRKWDDVASHGTDKETTNGAFTFGFGFEDDEHES